MFERLRSPATTVWAITKLVQDKPYNAFEQSWESTGVVFNTKREALEEMLFLQEQNESVTYNVVPTIL